MAKKRIVVMYGGKADEHSISCISAASALRALDTDKFEAIPVGITKDGKWIVNGENPLGWSLDEGLPTVEKTPGAKDVVLEVALGQDGFFAREDDGTLTPFGHVDAVFPVLHGPYGEDGTIQGLFEMMGVPYVGCGVLASAACMDKHYTKVLLAAAGIPVAPGITLDARSFDKASEFKANADAIMAQVSEAGLQYPLFVKPSRAGSSFGVTKVTAKEQIQPAIAKAFAEAQEVLVEAFMDGTEITCGCYKTKDKSVVFPITEVVSHNEYFDYEAKYNGASDEITPARISDDLTRRVQTLTSAIYDILGAYGIIRVDYIITEGEKINLLEVNTTPGMTATSFIPQQVRAAGMEMKDVMTDIIENKFKD